MPAPVPSPLLGVQVPLITWWAKGSKGDDSTLAQDHPFFTVAEQKGKDTAPKGGKKGKNKGKDGGHKGKGKGKGKGKDQKG